jgi:hypothetical protein
MINDLNDVPSDLVTTRPAPAALQAPKRVFPNGTVTTVAPEVTLPTTYAITLPEGYIGDNHIFGTWRDQPYVFSMGLWWNTPDKAHFQGLYGQTTQRGGLYPTTRYIPHTVYTAQAWGGAAFQHFILDALPKLALVLEPLHQDTEARLVTNTESAFAKWVLQKLDLWHRTLPSIGWAVKSPFVYQAKRAVYVDSGPAAKIDGRVRHGVYARGTLLPLQRALGVFEDPAQDVVIWVDRQSGHGRRHLHDDIKAGLQKALETLLHTTMVSASAWRPGDTLVEFKGSSGNYDDDLKLFQRARVVVGPHGGGLANAVLCKPGTALIELMPIEQLPTMKERHRTSVYAYYGLSQSAGLDYYSVPIRNFCFDCMPHHLDVDVGDVVAAVRHVVANPPTRLAHDAVPGKVVSSLTVNADFIAHLQSLPPIPKIVHIIWPDKNVIHSTSDMVKHGLRRLVDLNPEWEVVVHDDNDMIQTLQQSPLIPLEQKSLLKHAHPVEQSDAFRLLLMYTLGGVYIDLDRVVNIPFRHVILNKTRLLLPTHYDVNFAQDIMATAPGNRLFLHAFNTQHGLRTTFKRRKGWIRSKDIMLTGPSLWLTTVSRELFNQSTQDIAAARQALQAVHPVIVTKKDVWCDGLLVTPYAGCKHVRREELYREYGITPWTKAVDALWNV